MNCDHGNVFAKLELNGPERSLTKSIFVVSLGEVISVSGDGDQVCGGGVPGGVADALRMGDAFARYLNSPAAAGLDAAYAGFLRRFDAADAHNADGYGSSSAWLAARAQLTKRDARAAVRQMRQFGQRKHLAEALATGAITGSWAGAIAGWTKKLPAD